MALPVAVLGLAGPGSAGASTPVAGQIDPSFTPPAINEVLSSVTVGPDGKILIGGDFSQVESQTRIRVASLNLSGSLDSGFVSGLSGGQLQSVAAQPDGKVLVVGNVFSSSPSRDRVVRLNADGSIDTTLADPVVNSAVYSVAVQPDGKILIGGFFTVVGGQARKGVARLYPDGTLDTTFVDPDLDGPVYSIELQPDGRILVGGAFTQVGGQPRSKLARLNANGTLDITFANPNVDNTVESVVVQPDGRVLIGGGFGSVGGEGRFGVARLNADGTVDGTFLDPFVGGVVTSVELQIDNKVLIAGFFPSVDSQPRDLLARLNANGILDTTFVNPAIGGTGVQSMALQPDGKILTGGYLGGSPPTGRVRRVLATTPQRAPGTVSATAGNGQATVSWTAVPGEITGYSVTASPGGATCDATSSTTCTFTGLTNGTSYTFTIRAANGFGSGPASSPSNAVTPAAPTPDPPTPDPPGPTPDPPAPDPTVTLEQSRAKVTGKSVLVTSRIKVSGAGKIAQRATTGKGRKSRTWCRASKTVSAAGTHSLQCNLGSTGRKALRKGALKLTLRTTFTPTAGKAVSADRRLTVKRKR